MFRPVVLITLLVGIALAVESVKPVEPVQEKEVEFAWMLTFLGAERLSKGSMTEVSMTSVYITIASVVVGIAIKKIIWGDD